jgi:hypothetical protein
MSGVKPLGRNIRTRKQRRQAQLADRLEKVTWADCTFFSTYDRQHRVRLATDIEIEQLEIIEGGTFHAPPARKLFAVVKSISPHPCMRAYAMAPENIQTDGFSEADCQMIFEAVVPQCAHEVENLRLVLEMQDRGGAA